MGQGAGTEWVHGSDRCACVMHRVALWASIAALLLATGCGGQSSSTRRHGDGDPSSGGAGSGATGSSGGADPSANGGSGEPGDGGPGNGGSGDGGAGGSPGTGSVPGGAGGGAAGGLGAGGIGAAGGLGAGGLGAGGAPICAVPSSPLPEGTTEDRERAALIHDFCVTLERDGCLGRLGGSSFIHYETEGCSPDEILLACKQDRLYEYRQFILPPCDDEWRTAITCAASTSYTDQTCFTAGLMGSSTAPYPCKPEKDALAQCLQANNPWVTVTGTHTSCDFGPGMFAPCDMICAVGDNYFDIECGGPEGLPLRCGCSVNGRPIGDMDFMETRVFYANDCAAAAQRAADGECTNRLDCCIAYTDGGSEQCLCGSDANLLGYPTCEAAAAAANGLVVAICPQYESPPGSCWPPPCAN